MRVVHLVHFKLFRDCMGRCQSLVFSHMIPTVLRCFEITFIIDIVVCFKMPIIKLEVLYLVVILLLGVVCICKLIVELAEVEVT